jgi:regulator of nucleoside diphosphate kinase
MKTEHTGKTLYITEKDLEGLVLLLDIYILRNPDQYEYFEKLINDLDKATIIDEELVPDELVIINSKVSVIDLDLNKKMTFDLVSSYAVDPDNQKVSGLTPMGAAVLGYRTGDTVECNLPACKRRLKIDKVLHTRKEPGRMKLLT